MDVLAQLERACPGAVRSGSAGDAVDGVEPSFVVLPRKTPEVAEALRVAASQHLSVVARAGGTKLDWGLPPSSLDLVVDLSAMDTLLEHAADDLVARVEAGMPLAKLADQLSEAGQWFPLDEVVEGSTLGGATALGLSGPARYLHGAVRDLLLGATFVRADGVVARSGSKVVKNVAGYDLARLLAGSYGTLGVLTELTVRLRPLAASRRFVTASFADGRELAGPLAAVVRSQAAPAAVELERQDDGPLELQVLVEGLPRPLEQRAAELGRTLGESRLTDVAPPSWGRLPGPVTLKLTSILASITSIADRAVELLREHGVAGTLRGSAGSGVLFVGLGSDTAAATLSAILGGLREACGRAGGHATVLRAPAALKAELDVWGPVPGLELMRRVKERFDPERRLAPGRFVGGI